jgi:hypothetical protein
MPRELPEVDAINFRREARWMTLAMPLMILVGLLMALVGLPIVRWISAKASHDSTGGSDRVSGGTPFHLVH